MSFPPSSRKRSSPAPKPLESAAPPKKKSKAVAGEVFYVSLPHPKASNGGLGWGTRFLVYLSPRIQHSQFVIPHYTQEPSSLSTLIYVLPRTIRSLDLPEQPVGTHRRVLRSGHRIRRG